jgi:AGCS family alanine or glycine:cation symporter
MTIESILNQISGFIWGPLTLIFLLGVGVYLMLGLKGFPLKDLGYGFKSLFKKSKEDDLGDISPFESLMTALSATVGTGNIAGVATAIFLGAQVQFFGCGLLHYLGWQQNMQKLFLLYIFVKKTLRIILLEALCII